MKEQENQPEDEEERPESFSAGVFVVRYGVREEMIVHLVEEYGLPLREDDHGEWYLRVDEWLEWKDSHTDVYRWFKGPYEVYNGTWLDEILEEGFTSDTSPDSSR